MSSKLVLDYLEHQAAKGTAVEQWTSLHNLYSRRLWHQLTTQLETFIKNEIFNDGTALLELYDFLIKDIADRINPLSLVNMTVHVISRTRKTDPAGAIAFLEPIKEKVKNDQIATICVTTEFAALRIDMGEHEAAQELLNKCKGDMDALPGITAVHANYYRVSAHLYKLKGLFAEFYVAALRFLGCIELDSLTVEERVGYAFDLGLSALLGKGIYNFGELLAHGILDALRSTSQQWLIEFLYAFNSGNIAKYDELRPHWTAQQDLAVNEAALREKISLLSVMEVVFKRPAHSRRIAFSDIAAASQIPLEQTELLVMRSLSLGLVKGSIDQVEQIANLHWVQPRVLDISQLSHMLLKIKAWSDSVEAAAVHVEQATPELFVQ